MKGFEQALRIQETRQQQAQALMQQAYLATFASLAAQDFARAINEGQSNATDEQRARGEFPLPLNPGLVANAAFVYAKGALAKLGINVQEQNGRG